MTCNQQLSSCSRISSPPMPCWGTLCTLCLTKYVEIWLPCIAVAEDYLKNLSFLTMFTVLYVQDTSFWTWTLKDNCSNALPMWFTHNACADHCMSNANSQQQLYTSSLYNASDFSGLSVMWTWCHEMQGEGRDKNYMYLHLTVLKWSLLNLAGIPSQINLISQNKAKRHQSSSYRKCFSDSFNRE